MPNTAGQIARLVRLHCPQAPYFLVMSWLDEVYKDLALHFSSWSFLRAETQIITNPAKAGNCTANFGSNQIQDVTIGITASDLNRQFRTGQTSPIYTIIAVNTAVSPATFTIDQVYGAPSAVNTPATVGDFYITMPPNFARFLAVLDPPNNWQLRYWVSEEELNAWDSQRSATGTPRVLASRQLSATTAQSGQVQYELWPYQLAQYAYPTYYIQTPATLTDATIFQGPLANAANLLIAGALAKCAAWPGLDGKKNPYYNLSLAVAKEKEYQHQLGMLQNRDQEIYPTDWEAYSWLNRVSWAPLDAKFLQDHDAGLMGDTSAMGFGAGAFF